MSDEPKAHTGQELLQLLADKQILSAAQVQLATADQAVTGMSMDEVLLARGWIDQKSLEELAPWLKPSPQDVVQFDSATRSYEDNLKLYRRLMEKILGTSWD